MPETAPLAMPRQSLGARAGHAGEVCPAPLDPTRRHWGWRVAVFAPAIGTTAALIYAVEGWLSMSGLSGLEHALLALMGMTFFWVCLSVSTATAGLIGRLLWRSAHRTERPRPTTGMRTALLVPIYNEVPWDVFGNAAAMLHDVAARAHGHDFTLFVLSDTQDLDIADQEWRAFQRLRARAPASIQVHYRRRVQNTDRKVGNLTDWIENWGGGYEAMLVLDADSLMTGEAILALTDHMAADPQAGLIQSCPRLIGAETLFARVQQFSSVAYGWLLAEGLALWSQQEGNYWGHNAIIRTRAFAQSAGLPRLRSFTGKGKLIMSHDFVEAGLLRRAGWRVRFLPEIEGSYEETPASLVDFVLRDRRWCQGNLQHLRLLAARGLHPVSRFHLFHGAIAYLLSPAWFALLIIWALLGTSEDSSVIRYFSEANPLFPDWPQMSQTDSMVFLLFMYSMLLAPKVMGVLMIALSPSTRKAHGGSRRFLTAFVFEVLASIAYAPIMMVQQTIAVARGIFGLGNSWSPQNRQGASYHWTTLLRFHWLETVTGALLVTGLVTGMVSLWLMPIAASLILAVPLSMLSAFNLAKRTKSAFRLDTPETLAEPAIIARARAERSSLHSMLLQEEPQKIAAE